MKFLLTLSIFLSGFFLKAENPSDSVESEVSFISYLVKNNEFESAVNLCNRLLIRPDLTPKIIDSLYFTKGWCFYSQKKLDSAALYFALTDTSLSSYAKARFFGFICYSYQKQYDEARHLLENAVFSREDELKMRQFLLSGLSLLERNLDDYQTIRKELDTNWFLISNEVTKLDKYASLISSFKERKKITTAILSAFIPGLGKIYAGRPGDGVAAFLITSSLGLVSFENYRKDGIKDIKTLFFSGLFLTYYLGNIFGSYYSVNLEKNEFYGQIDYNILFDLHIPVRNMYF